MPVEGGRGAACLRAAATRSLTPRRPYVRPHPPRAAAVRHTVAIAMAIERSEVLTDAQSRLLVAQLLAAIAEG